MVSHQSASISAPSVDSNGAGAASTSVPSVTSHAATISVAASAPASASKSNLAAAVAAVAAPIAAQSPTCTESARHPSTAQLRDRHQQLLRELAQVQQELKRQETNISSSSADAAAPSSSAGAAPLSSADAAAPSSSAGAGASVLPTPPVASEQTTTMTKAAVAETAVSNSGNATVVDASTLARHLVFTLVSDNASASQSTTAASGAVWAHMRQHFLSAHRMQSGPCMATSDPAAVVIKFSTVKKANRIFSRCQSAASADGFEFGVYRARIRRATAADISQCKTAVDSEVLSPPSSEAAPVITSADASSMHHPLSPRPSSHLQFLRRKLHWPV
jgi:hypothetical protein